MANDEKLLRLLASIDRRLALLIAPQDRELRQSLKTDLLRTPARIAMFEGIDGRRGSRELAQLGSVSDRAVRFFIKELLDMGLVRPSATESGGRGIIVERDEDALVQWYLERAV